MSHGAKDFAAMVRGDHPDAQSYKRYVLAELRAAIVRTKLAAKELAAIGIALKFDFIDADTALAWAAEAHVIEYLQPEEPDDGVQVHEGREVEGGAAGDSNEAERLSEVGGVGEAKAG